MGNEHLTRSGIVMRDLQEDDIPDVTAIFEQVVRDPQTDEIDKERIDEIVKGIQTTHHKDQRYIVAETPQDGVVGITALQKADKDLRILAFTNNPLELMGVFTSPQHQGKGVGRKLLEEAFRTARKMNYLELIVKRGLLHEKSHTFYRHMGFERVGMLSRPDRGAALVLSKVVPENLPQS